MPPINKDTKQSTLMNINTFAGTLNISDTGNEDRIILFGQHQRYCSPGQFGYQDEQGWNKKRTKFILHKSVELETFTKKTMVGERKAGEFLPHKRSLFLQVNVAWILWLLF